MKIAFRHQWIKVHTACPKPNCNAQRPKASKENTIYRRQKKVLDGI